MREHPPAHAGGFYSKGRAAIGGCVPPEYKP